MDAFFDLNERRWFITPQSVELAIQEERAKAVKAAEPMTESETSPQRERSESADEEDSAVTELRKEIFDLKITNRAKDMFIEQLQSERQAFAEERRDYVDQLMSFSRQMGELKAPRSHSLG